MLNFMRRAARSTAIKVVLGVIVVVFMFWGVGTFTGDTGTWAAVVNGREISPEALRRTAIQIETFYRRLYGENFSPELAQALDFRNRALDQMINTALLVDEARRLGLSVSDEQLRESIASIEGLSVNGVFRRDVYFRFLRSQGMTPGEFEAEHRHALLVQQLQDVVSRSVRPEPDFARKMWLFDNEKVNVSFVRVPASAYTEEVEVSDQEIAAHYESHRESYREPERAAIELLVYDNDDFEDRVEVSDDDVRHEYETWREERYTLPEEVHARHILFRVPPDADEETREAARRRAEETLQRLRDGDDFVALASELSEDPATREEGGDLGFFARGRMEESFEETAFSLEPGKVSDVVETRFGVHLILVEEKRPERVQPLEEVRDSIVERLKTTEAREAARNAAFDDQQLALAGKALEKIAEARGLEVRTPPPFAANETVVGLPRIPDFVTDVFASTTGEVGPVAQGEKVFVLYRVKERIPSNVPPLEEVRSRVEREVRTRKASEQAKAAAKEVHEAVGGGKPLAEVAAARELEVEETGPISRRGAYVPRVGNIEGVKEKLFDLEGDDALYPEVVEADGDAFVLVRQSRVEADPEEFEKQKDEIVERQRQEQQQAALEALLNDLKRRADIRLNPAVASGV